jgi:hypothetical protein
MRKGLEAEVLVDLGRVLVYPLLLELTTQLLLAAVVLLCQRLIRLEMLVQTLFFLPSLRLVVVQAEILQLMAVTEVLEEAAAQAHPQGRVGQEIPHLRHHHKAAMVVLEQTQVVRVAAVVQGK